MSIDLQSRFKRVRKGYDPQEVDAVLDEMQAALDKMQEEIADLKQQKRNLSEAITQYNTKIERFEGGARLLEQEQTKESRKLEVLRDWDEHLEAVWNMLIVVDRNLHTVSEGLLSKMEMLVNKVMKDVQPASSAMTEMPAARVYRPEFADGGTPAAHSGSVKQSRSKTIYLHAADL